MKHWIPVNILLVDHSQLVEDKGNLLVQILKMTREKGLTILRNNLNTVINGNLISESFHAIKKFITTENLYGVRSLKTSNEY